MNKMCDFDLCLPKNSSRVLPVTNYAVENGYIYVYTPAKSLRGTRLSLEERERFLCVKTVNPLRYIWFNEEGLVHRDNDLPAVVNVASKKQQWWEGGKKHRLRAPAVIHENGSEEWWSGGRRHRGAGLPATVFSDGSKIWWVEGVKHRIGAPAVEYADGGEEWWVGGYRHRLDGPAVVFKGGNEQWWVNNVLGSFNEDCERACYERVSLSDVVQLVFSYEPTIFHLALHNLLNNFDVPTETLYDIYMNAGLPESLCEEILAKDSTFAGWRIAKKLASGK